MPMGIVSDNDFDSELTPSIAPKVDGAIIKKPTPGRSEGDVNVPEVLRKIIGEHSEIEGRAGALSIAQAFDVSPSSVSAYSHGATSTATIDKPKDELIEYINHRKGRLTKRALKVLNTAIIKLIEDKSKLADCNGPQLASVASIMSGVVKNLEPTDNRKSNDNENKLPAFVIMQPVIKSEESYAVINSRDNY